MRLFSVVDKLLKKTVHSVPHQITFVIFLAAGIVSCMRVQDITSESILKISQEKFISIDWSPDGSTLFAIGPHYHATTISHLYSIEVASGDSAKLTEDFDAYDLSSWSPNGEKVALTVDLNTIWIFDVASRQTTYLTAGEGATWFPEGDKLAIYMGPNSIKGADHREIRIVDLEGNVHSTIDVGEVIPELLQLQPYHVNPQEYLYGLEISPDGGYVLLSLYLYKGRQEGQDSGEERHEAYLVDLRNESVLPFLIDEPVSVASWSPDGTKIVYIRPKGLRRGELVIVNNEGVCQLIPDLPPEIKSPTWSKGGQHIAFLYWGEIHILDINLYLELEDSGCP